MVKRKRCIDCRKMLLVDDFYLLRKGGSSRQSRCKRCDNRKRAGNAWRAESRVGNAWRAESRVVVEVIRHPDGSLETRKRPRPAGVE